MNFMKKILDKNTSHLHQMTILSKPVPLKPLTSKPLTSKPGLQIVGVGLLALGLTACGGDDSSHSVVTPETAAASFSESATWEIDGQVTEACFDIDSKQDITCNSDTWDVKFTAANRDYKLWTNGGISGDGHGAAVSTMLWKELAELKNAQEMPEPHFKMDSGSGVFKANPWYAYNLNQHHKLAPNNRVYLVTTDANDFSSTSTINKPVYALQVINYYNDAGNSGYPSIRWIDTALPNQVKTKTIDASSSDKWVYFDLKTGTITTQNGNWQVGLKRNEVMLNGGISGSANVGGYLAKTPAGYYDANGDPIKSKFMQDNTAESLPDLTTVSAYDIKPNAVPWIKDEANSNLNPKPTGNYPVIDYGWYVYKGNEGHRLFVKPEVDRIGGLIRSAQGNSYARFYLDEIEYIGNATLPSKWIYKFEIQPATAK